MTDLELFNEYQLAMKASGEALETLARIALLSPVEKPTEVELEIAAAQVETATERTEKAHQAILLRIAQRWARFYLD